MGRQNLSSLVGREVYTRTGLYVGEVEDTVLDLTNQETKGLALSPVNSEFREALEGKRGGLVPYRWVNQVGDIILIQDVIQFPTGADAES